MPQDRIRQTVDSINLDYREVQTRGGPLWTSTGLTCRHRRRRLQWTYKSQRLMRTKAMLARDNPVGLTFFFT